MVESNNNQFYIQYRTPRPRRIQTPKSNVIAKSIANARKRNPIPVRTQRIKSTPRRVTKQTPVNYKKIVKEAINKYNEANAAKALLNLNPKPDAKANSMTGADKKKKSRVEMTEAKREKLRKQKRESARKRVNSMTEANLEKFRKYHREYQKKRYMEMSESNKEKRKQYMKAYQKKRQVVMTESNKEKRKQYMKVYKSRPKSANKK